MMWISKYKYDRIIARLDELESATQVRGTGLGFHVGAAVKLLMDHLGLHHERTFPYDRLVKKGGPERGE